ncbi:MAG: ATP-binding protein [Candidatus Omnitrophota bacterium]
MKIAKKISLSFLATAIVIVSVVGPILYIIFSDSLKQAIFDHLSTTIQSRRHHIETLLKEYAHTAKMLALSSSFKNVFNENLDYDARIKNASDKIQTVLNTHIDFFEILIFDENGKIMVSNQPLMETIKKERLNKFTLEEKDVYYEDMHILDPSRVIGICIAVPIYFENERKGFICFQVKAEEIYDILTDKTGLGETGEIYLVNREGYMISPSRFLEDTFLKLKVDTESTRKYFEDVRIYKDTSHPHIPFLAKGYRDVLVLGEHDHLNSMQWGVFAEIDETEALMPLKIMRNVIAGTVLIVPLIAWILGILVARVIANPIWRLHECTEMIGKGNLDYKCEVTTKDEVGQLSTAFNKMTHNLQQTTTSITNLNKEIDERKRTARKLAESRAQLKGLLDGSPDLIAQIDTNMKVVWANKAALDLYPDVMGRFCYKAYGDGSDGPCKGCPCIRAMKTGKIETDIVYKPHLPGIEGETYWEDIGVPIKDERGDVVGVIDIARNITERRIAQQELEFAHKRIEYILGATKTGLDVIDADYNVIYVDSEWRKIYGDPKGKKCYEYFMGRNVPCEVCGIKKALETKQIVVTEEKLPREGNRLVQVTTIPFQDEKGEWLVAEINMDITERQRAEQEVKRAVEIKSEFISIVSHELRTPLTAIREGINILSDETTGPLSDMQKNFIKLTQRNVERLSRLINDVLNFQKLEADKVVFKMIKNDINEVVQEAKKIMEPIAQNKEINIAVSAAMYLPRFKFDRDKIMQVVTNMLDNAIKHMGKGDVIITTSMEEEQSVRVSVKDTGKGIRKKDIPKLFHTFEQIEKGKNRKTGGTGLGLAICKDIVEKHGGRIWVESKLNKGAEFIFVLPIR